ncbi:hypothetical protein GQ600_11535 [Phytophthora cactorum]|nr:hypothetical protein GQ600_11535 [Phytophthora cactorum]
MYSSTLHPPNSHLLRDEVVTGVVVRAWRANRVGFGTPVYQSRTTGYDSVEGNPSHAWGENDGTSESQAPISVGEISQIDSKRKRTEPTRITSFKRLKTASQDEMYKAIAELLELGERVQRERRREVQQRYRMKQKRLIDNLDKTIQELRQDIKTLEKRRRCAPPITPATNGVWESVVHFFRLVRLGFEPSDRLDSVREALAPDVVYNTECGFEAIVRGWSFMKWFGDVEVTVENLSKSARNSMIVTTRTSVTITERTLSNVFPHLPNPKIGDSKATLASKLLGQRIIMRGSTCFEWDAATKRVTSVVAQSDMLTPILRLLGSLEAVSQVFDKALVSPSFQWVSTSSETNDTII